MIDAGDAVLAILDGPDADSGTSVELGYAHARGIPVVDALTTLADRVAPALEALRPPRGRGRRRRWRPPPAPDTMLR